MTTDTQQEVAGLLDDNIVFQNKKQIYERPKDNMFRIFMAFILFFAIVFVIIMLVPNVSFIKPVDVNHPMLSNISSLDISSLNISHIANPFYNCSSYNCSYGYLSSTHSWIQPTFISRNAPMTLHKQQNDQFSTNNCNYIFIGDSIIFKWTTMGAKNVLEKYFHWNQSIIYAIGGITTHDVGWRLKQGNGFNSMSKCLKSSNSNNIKHLILLISTNDFGNGLKVKYIIKDYEALVTQIVNYLSDWSYVRLYVIAVFPRADIYPSHNVQIQWDKNNKYFHVINYMNNYIQTLANKYKLVHFIDCNKQLLNGTNVMHSSIFYDMLHLSTTGYEIFAKCILENI
eukprot:108505_1